MPGFGSGPFGQQPAGKWGWARATLYETMPVVYRTEDAAQGGLLQKYAEGQFYSFENLRQHIRGFSELRDPFKVRSSYTQTAFLTLGKQILPVGNADQTGALGRVFSAGTFTAQDRTAKFTTADIGKQLIVKRSNVPVNNQQTFTITSIVSPKEVFTDPLIAVDGGPIRWEVRTRVDLPRGEVELELRGGDPRGIEIGWSVSDGAQTYPVIARQMYWQPITNNQQLNEREANDGTVDALGTVGSATYNFKQTDIGKLLFVSGEEDTTGGLHEIVAVESGRAVIGRLDVPGANNDPQGKLTYRYKLTADRPVSIRHIVEEGADLPLEVTFQSDARNQNRFDVTVRLATNAAQEPVSIPSQVATAVAAHPIVSKFVEADRTVPTGTETPVGECDRLPIKGRRLPETTRGLFWALRPFARITLQGDLPLGAVDGENWDLQVPPDAFGDPLHPSDSTTRVFAASSPFRAGDIGKLLSIHGSTAGNDGSYEILAVSGDGSKATIAAYLQVDTNERYWERRTTPLIRPDPTRLNPTNIEVKANAQSLLDILAYDFGIAVDTQQIEERQRSWVRQVSQWIAVKGTEEAIRDVAHLSGFTVEVDSLFTAVPHPNTAPSASALGYDFLFVGDDGRIRYTGTLTNVGGYAEFSDPTQAFLPSDAGRVLNIGNSGASGPSNDNFWVISDVLNSTTVRLYQPAIGGSLGPPTPINFTEPNNGTLFSTVGQLFADVQPSFVLMDDVELDYLAVMCDVVGRDQYNRPGIDVFCRVRPVIVGSTAVIPEAVSACGGSQIVSITSVSNVHTVLVQGDDLSVFIGGGWKLTDSDLNELFIDAPPTLVSLGTAVPVTHTDLNGDSQTVDTYPNAIYSITVSSTVPPVTGPVAFTYICTLVIDCHFCPSYRVLIDLTADRILSEGALANDRAFERTVRLIDQTLPAHVEAIYRFNAAFQTGSAFFTSVTGSADIVIPVDFVDSFDFSGSWPGTVAAIPNPTFPTTDFSDDFGYGENWPGTAAAIPSPTFPPPFDEDDSFDTADGWPGT